MKKFITAIGLCLVIGIPAASAAEVEVKFTEPDNYVDIRSGDENSYSYRENVFYNIEKELKKLAKKLPQGQTLKIEVLDLDLAGDIRMVHTNLIRVIKTMYPPRMKFTYQLQDANEKAIVQGEENIRDTSFMTNQSLKYKRDPYGYEKQLLSDWFKETFADKLVAKP